MPRPACTPPVLSAPLFLASVIRNTVRVSNSFDLSCQTLARTVCRQKWQRRCPPPIPWRKSLEVNMNGTHGSSQGVQVHWQLLYFCLTTHRHSSYEDWTTALSLIQWTGDAKAKSGVFLNYFIYMCVCVGGGGGGGGGSSNFFHFPKFQGVQHMFSKGLESNC